ncbi:MAG: tRNA (cytidine(34)-2'-O)-methyltransferase [Parvibaculum sp.]
MRLALFQPDIPQNTGTLIRLGACLGVGIDIIEPTGFPWGDRALKRAGLDYWEFAEVRRHADWTSFYSAHAELAKQETARLVLLTTKSDTAYTDFSFEPGDTLLLGQETVGAPPEVHAAVDARITIPMQSGRRSINIALAAAMVLGEALRQTKGFASPDREPA